MIKFIKHCIKYFTHIIPIEIKKDYLEKDNWYKVNCYMYLDKKNNVSFDEIRIDKQSNESYKQN